MGSAAPLSSSRRLQLFAAKLVRGLLIFVGVAPLFSVLAHYLPPLGPLAALCDVWFEFQCHREPERSLHLLGHVLPVCTRCSGIYFGLGLGALVLKPQLDVWPLRLWVGFAAAVMILDVWTEDLDMRPPSVVLRLVTGMFLAYPVAIAVVTALREGAQPSDEAQIPKM